MLVFLPTKINADSLTVSPIGLSYHGKNNSELAPYAPRKLDSKAAFTWHPEFNLSYKTKYMQYTAFWMRDTVNQDAGGLLLGPKVDFLKYISVGMLVGTFIRPDRYYSFVHANMFGLQVIPMAGATFSFRIPVHKNISIETNVMGNYVINHAVSGLRFDF